MSTHEGRPPYPRDGRLWDHTISGRQRGVRHDFLLILGLDPARVPDGARIDHDDTTGEWRLEYINPGGHLVWVRRLPGSPPGGYHRGGRITTAIPERLQWLRDHHRAGAVHIGTWHETAVTITDDPVRYGDPVRDPAAQQWFDAMRGAGGRPVTGVA